MIAAGAGGALVAYLDGSPVALAGVEVADGVARLWAAQCWRRTAAAASTVPW